MIEIRFLRGTTAQNNAHTGALGTFTIDTQLRQLRLHDGVTAGGHVIGDASADLTLVNQRIDELAVEDISGLSTALAGKVDTSLVGANNGIAPLDANGRVPSANLPSYVDDVIEVADPTALQLLVTNETAEQGKIYVVLSNNNVFRYSGTVMVEIVASPGSTDAITEGVTNLYFTQARARAAISVTGDLTYNEATGEIGFDLPDITKADVGLGSVENYPMATDVEAVTATATNRYMSPQRVRDFIESMGFVQDGGDWIIDQGSL